MVEIEKKIWPEFFKKILSGEKKFELRLADFDCSVGDILMLREWDPEKGEYTGRFIKKKASYILKTKNISFYTKKEINKWGLQVISLE